MDENLADGKETHDPPLRAAPAPAGDGAAALYTAAAQADQQPRITDFIPKRPWTIWVAAIAGLATIAGLQALYGQTHQWPLETRIAEFQSLHPSAFGGLASWLTSLCLLAAALQSLLVLRLRQHRTDDYRGRYRIWAAIPVLFLVTAVCVGTGIHRDVAAVVGVLADGTNGTDRTDGTDVNSFLPLVAALIALAAGLRLFFEVRVSRLATGFLGMAIGCYLLAALSFGGLVGFQTEALTVMTQTTLAMLGHWAAFFCVTSFARFVFLEVHGLLAAKVAKPKREKKVKQAKPAKVKAAKVKPESETADEPVETTSAAKLEPKPRPKLKIEDGGEFDEEFGRVPHKAAAPAAASEPVARPAEKTPLKVADRTPLKVEKTPSGKPAETKPPEIKATVAKTPEIKSPNSRFDDDDDADDAADSLSMDDDGESGLSKADRRRMKKLKKRDQQQRRAA